MAAQAPYFTGSSSAQASSGASGFQFGNVSIGSPGGAVPAWLIVAGLAVAGLAVWLIYRK